MKYMELSEAKERVKNLINTSAMGIILHPNDKDLFSRDKEALETVLKALDNSISKDEVRKKIAEINSIGWQPGIRTAGKSVKYWKMVGAENALKELLGEE